MNTTSRIETELHRTIAAITSGECPPRLADAVRYAVFPPGHRLRPRLTLGVAGAIGEQIPELATGAAVALELLHCASLIQDDLPAFDDAMLRRGRPALPRVFGAATAVLASDALIVGAFETLGMLTRFHPERAATIIAVVARGAGAAAGAVAGQGWELEPRVDLARYHRAKTAALFEAATTAGAIAAGDDPALWRDTGLWFGRAYQLADDIADAGTPYESGSDAALGRPNVTAELGVHASAALFDRYVDRALLAIPPCRGRAALRAAIGSGLRGLVERAVVA